MRELPPVAATWGSILARLAALAMVIALSPVTVLPAILVLHAPRPRPSSLSFLGGWLLGLTALTAVFVGASDMLGDLSKTPPRWASWLRVGFGAALIAFGIIWWLTRRSQTHAPAWMNTFSRLTPIRAGLTGVVLALVRPEVLIVCAVAGLAIGTSGLGVAAGWISAAFFVVVAASTVGIPIVAYAGAGQRLDDSLTRVKIWMEQNSAALVAVVLILIGLMVVYNGIRAL
ncbi:GAP family protein [Mycobacterium kubicae]|uniref:GAP family protein n=1 Tax=Mycobacterium kubicae TaxID=120959 RepID=UPI000800FC73|nr:GAP family protein [Mycobacterium kubicae]OBK44635.1 hypothetical protein A5657_04270 [Mycobacterium kubicae]